jgi:hypothetical protein
MKTNIVQWSKYTLMQRYNKIWTKIKAKKKAKRSSRKREHSLNDKSENRVFLAKKNGVRLLQKKFVGVQPFIAANKTKENWKQK